MVVRARKPPGKVKVTGHGVVSVGGLRGLSGMVRSAGLSGTAGAELGARLKEAGELVAGIARANASEVGTRLPGSVRVRGGRTGVYIVAGGPKAPYGYTAETAARHPLFGNRDYWYQGPDHPFLGPAGDEGAEGAAEIVAQVISDWAFEYGFE